MCILLAVASLAAFWPVLGNPFISLDDPEYLIHNPHMKDGITVQGIQWAFTSGYEANWHPLTWISHMLDAQLFGLNPAGHHLTNLLLHIANSVLLFLCLKRMTDRLWPGAFVAALFALHPLHVESVAWISERKDVLSAFFWMLTLWCYLRYCERRTLRNYMLVLLAFALGVLSKQMVVTLPFVLLLLDYWPLGRLRFGLAESTIESRFGGKLSFFALLKEKAPLFALAIIGSVTIYLVQRSAGAMTSRELFPIGARFSNAIVSYIVYLRKTLWPVDLAIFYPHPGASLQAWEIGGAVLVVGVISAFAFWNVRRFPYLTVGWLWYLGCLVPVLGLVQVGMQARADRYTYIPLIGIFIMISWGLPELLGRRKQRGVVLAAPAILILGSCLMLTFTQVGFWRNDASLFAHALTVTEGNYLAHNNLGSALEKLGKLDSAIVHYREAIRLKPDYALAHKNLGAAFGKEREFDEAAVHLADALRLNPDDADAHADFGTVDAQQGKLADAIVEFSEAVRLNPELMNAHLGLGNLLLRSGRTEAAISHYLKVIELDPLQENAHLKLGLAYAQEGRVDDATAEYSRVLMINPGNVNALYDIGLALAQKGKLEDAVRRFAKALEINPGSADAHNALGTVYARLGRTSDAAREFSAALRVNSRDFNAHLNLGILLEQQDSLREAIVHYSKALEIEPGNPRAQVALSNARQLETNKRGVRGR